MGVMRLLVIEILTAAYPLMGLVAMLAYGPQLKRFLTSTEACRHAPLSTWVLWTAQCFVFFLYALVVNGDRLFVFTQTGFFVVCGACLVALLYGRHGKRALPDRRGELPPRVG